MVQKGISKLPIPKTAKNLTAWFLLDGIVVRFTVPQKVGTAEVEATFYGILRGSRFKVRTSNWGDTPIDLESQYRPWHSSEFGMGDYFSLSIHELLKIKTIRYYDKQGDTPHEIYGAVSSIHVFFHKGYSLTGLTSTKRPYMYSDLGCCSQGVNTVDTFIPCQGIKNSVAFDITIED